MCEEEHDPWCHDFDAHKPAHEFCGDPSVHVVPPL